jgi:para-nitrobenzyl esterase
MKFLRTRPAGAGALLGALALMILAAPATAQIQAGTLITLDDGMVQGQINNDAREFLGIPYAAPPVGPLRWRPPAPVDPWIDPLDATVWPGSCPQGGGIVGTPSTNEDCLYLNVWTPEPAPAEPLPVMVWIHGGGNTTGSVSDLVPFPPYEAERLYDANVLSSEQNVVVVTINYRLGVFGFFGHPDLIGEDEDYPYAGNQGLLDQRQALEWVRDNILAFGGDPDKVTIFGESAGSWNVCAHVVSPMSAGLFHRAISQSGGCSVGARTLDQSQAAAAAVSVAVGCDAEIDELACLRATDVSDLLANQGAGEDDGSSVPNLSISIDGGFMPDNPKDIFDSGEFSRVPYLLGANKDEGTLFFVDSDPVETDEEYQAELFGRFGDFAAVVEATYPASFFPNPQEALVRVFGDAALVCPTYDVAGRVSAAKSQKTAEGVRLKRAKTYAYIFAREIPVAAISLLDLRAFHGAELAYVFGSIESPTPTDNAIRQAIQSYWASFADKGKPTARKQPGWGKFKTKSWKQVLFNSQITKQKGFRQSVCEFWTAYYETL